MTSVTRDAKQSSEAPNLRDLIEMIPGLVLCALPDGSAEFANRAWQEYAGCSLEQLTGCGWQTVIHPDDMTKFNSEWSASPAAEKPFETEARMRRADGHYHWFSIRNGPAVSETRSSKASLRTLIAFEDINERKEAQVKLKLSEALQQAFCDNSPNLIWLEDR
jgi:PAS domain S-box-containing protein